MPDGSGLIEARDRRTLSALVGRRVASVVSYRLRCDPQDGVQWDFDQWHDPEMGVELVLDDGSVYSAIWGDAFGHFGLDLVPEPMRNLLISVGEPDGPRVWEVTTHPRWASLLRQPIRDAELVWNGDAADEGPVPVAIRLRFSLGMRGWLRGARRLATSRPVPAGHGRGDGDLHAGPGGQTRPHPAQPTAPYPRRHQCGVHQAAHPAGNQDHALILIHHRARHDHRFGRLADSPLEQLAREPAGGGVTQAAQPAVGGSIQSDDGVE
jgi:hypothetical protein